MISKPCRWCGSKNHDDIHCRIKQKADLMLAGVPPGLLFDIIEADSLEEAAKEDDT